MPKSLAKTIILIALMTLIGACGPAATAVPPLATVVAPAPTTAPPTNIVGPPTATTVPFTPAPTPLPPTPPAAAPAPTSKASAQGFLLEGVGFRTPESVLYDPKADLYLVANIHGDPSARDGNGFISRVSPEGQVVALKWIDGQAEGVTLNAPKGMALTGERLFVADIDVVRVFDRNNGAPLAEIAKAPGFLMTLPLTREERSMSPTRRPACFTALDLMGLWSRQAGSKTQTASRCTAG